jgi:hypothetical protein
MMKPKQQEAIQRKTSDREALKLEATLYRFVGIAIKNSEISRENVVEFGLKPDYVPLRVAREFIYDRKNYHAQYGDDKIYLRKRIVVNDKDTWVFTEHPDGWTGPMESDHPVDEYFQLKAANPKLRIEDIDRQPLYYTNSNVQRQRKESEPSGQQTESNAKAKNQTQKELAVA